jgi:N-acetylmuramoyl-L-alanine amidase
MSSDWVNKNKLFLSLTPAQLLALTGYGEAGKEGDAGIVAVMNVVKNRTREGKYKDVEILSLTGSPYHAVILKKAQFSMYNLTDPVREKVERFAELWANTISGNSYVKNCYQLAQKVISGEIKDNTKGATHYHAASVSPSWAKTIPYIGQIGNHIFYGEQAEGTVDTATSITSVSPSPLGWVVLAGLSGLFFLWLMTNKRKGGARYAQYD